MKVYVNNIALVFENQNKSAQSNIPYLYYKVDSIDEIDALVGLIMQHQVKGIQQISIHVPDVSKALEHLKKKALT